MNIYTTEQKPAYEAGDLLGMCTKWNTKKIKIL